VWRSVYQELRPAFRAYYANEDADGAADLGLTDVGPQSVPPGGSVPCPTGADDDRNGQVHVVLAEGSHFLCARPVRRDTTM
jgi:hypothetical protein